MSKTPKTDSEQVNAECFAYNQKVVGASMAREFETAGNALHERLEHWIQMNSGICDPKDAEAIENWKKATQ